MYIYRCVSQVSVCLQKEEAGEVKDFLQVVVDSIRFDLTERTWDRRGAMMLKSVTVVDHLTKGT